MIKNSPIHTSDQQSIISQKCRASRLSNLNPIRNRNVSNLSNISIPKAINTPPSLKSPTILGFGNEYQLSPQSTNISYHHPPPIPALYQTNTQQNEVLEDSYKLIRIESNKSINSNYSLQSQYKVNLNLNKKEIELIRYTWNIMLLDEENSVSGKIPGLFKKNNASTIASSLFCRQFYSNLLSMSPELEKLFPSIKHQAVAFAGVMSFAITQLENLSNLDDYLNKLGKRHSRILGIEPSQFELMGEALIETFHERFGYKFTRELEILWIKLYLYLSNSLLQFGIDPVLKFNKDYQDSRFSTDDLLDLDKRSSISTGVTSANYSTSYDSFNPTATKKKPTMLHQDSFISHQRDPSTATFSSSSSTIKKKKRNCVIM